jgi:hypothetical protein
MASKGNVDVQWRRWVQASREVVKQIRGQHVEARRIATAWIQQNAKWYVIGYSTMRLHEQHREWQERNRDSVRIRRSMAQVAFHLKKAQEALKEIPRLAFAADYIGHQVLKDFHVRIERIKDNLPVLGGKKLPKGQPPETHLNWFIYVLCQHLMKMTKQDLGVIWMEVADYVNDYKFRKPLSAGGVEARYKRYRAKDRNALAKAEAEAKAHWDLSDTDGA